MLLLYSQFYGFLCFSMKKPELLYVKTGFLRPNIWNPNHLSEADLERLAQSIARLEMFKPIVVRQIELIDPDSEARYEILGGAHRYLAALRLGWTEVPIIDLGVVVEQTAREIALVDNTRYGTDDPLKLSEFLKEFDSLEEFPEFLPYSSEDLDALIGTSSIRIDDLELGTSADFGDHSLSGDLTDYSRSHQVMRIAVPIEVAELVKDRIERFAKEKNYFDLAASAFTADGRPLNRNAVMQQAAGLVLLDLLRIS